MSCAGVRFPGAPQHYWKKVLTPFQATVVELVADDRELTNEQISQLLDVHPDTVKHHLSEACKAMGVKRRMGAARWWWEHVELAEHTAHREATRQEYDS